MPTGTSFTEAVGGLGVGAAELFDEVVAQAPFGVYVDQVQHGCVYANATLLQQFGVPWSDFAGFGWARFIHPEDGVALQSAIHEYEHTLEPIYVRYRILRPDGATRWVYARVRAVTDASGHHTGSVGVTEDITEQRLFRDRSATAQKLEAIGRLSGRIAHDFNNLLGVMLGMTELLGRDVTSVTGHQHLATISETVDQARQITDQLLALSPSRVASRKPTQIDASLARLEPLVRRSLGEGIELVFQPAAGSAHVFLDSGQFGQVLINLATNARDAVKGRGRVRISTQPSERGVQLVVEDDGEGMPAEVVERAFEPFFTTKDPGRGTGLGLSTVRDLVSLADGAISIESEPGKGTRVVVEFPLARGDFAPEVLGDLAAPRPLGGGEAVLFVEDHDALRQSLGYALALQGYRVLPARRVGDALEIARRDEIDAVVTDVLLPDGEGPAIVRDVRSRRPGIAVVYISGFPGRAAGELETDDPATVFVPKPFRPQQLVEALARALQASRSSGKG
jgi:PAS domain S-box-containing protein